MGLRGIVTAVLAIASKNEWPIEQDKSSRTQYDNAYKSYSQFSVIEGVAVWTCVWTLPNAVESKRSWLSGTSERRNATSRYQSDNRSIEDVDLYETSPLS